MRKIVKFLKRNNKEKLLLLEAFFYLGGARILKGKKFNKVAPSLGKKTSETSYTIKQEDLEILERISKAISIVSRYTPWESKCLVQAIAAMKMLERRSIDCTLYLGTAKDEEGKMIAHAWVRSGSFIVTGSLGKERFTVVYTFAKFFKREEVAQTRIFS